VSQCMQLVDREKAHCRNACSRWCKCRPVSLYYSILTMEKISDVKRATASTRCSRTWQCLHSKLQNLRDHTGSPSRFFFTTSCVRSVSCVAICVSAAIRNLLCFILITYPRLSASVTARVCAVHLMPWFHDEHGPSLGLSLLHHERYRNLTYPVHAEHGPSIWRQE
jgi:hypothetical protein